jgi:hypothetical protein
MFVAGAEIIGFDRIALRVALSRDQDRGVANIMLLDRYAIFQLDGPKATRIGIVPSLVIQQGRKDGVAVHARDARPYHAPGPVDQG